MRPRKSTLRAGAFIGIVALAGVAIVGSALRPEPSAHRATSDAPAATRTSVPSALSSPVAASRNAPPRSAVLQVVVEKNLQHPAAAAPQFSRDDPLKARDQGYAVIAKFQSSGDFERAAEYAVAETGEYRRDFLIAAFHEWGRQKPEQAFTSALQVADATARETAMQSALSGWARTDPKSLAELAVDRPDGPEKTAALTKALREWVHQDPWTAGDWIAAHESTIPVVEKMFRDERR
jgi:hypothetical protein